MEATGDEQDFTDVGHECHIIARNDDPQVARSVSSLTVEEREQFRELIENRHGFSNLVLMCLRHSRIIDDPKQGHGVARVVEIKRAHEAAMNERRSPQDRRDAAAELAYAAIVDEWEDRIGLDDWERRVGPLVADGHPRMDIKHFDDLRSAGHWLFTRVWPRTNPDLERAFENLRVVVQDLLNVLDRYPHAHLRETGLVGIARFYNDPSYWGQGEPDFAALDEMYDYWSALVEDLAYELTRAVNLVCDVVRRTLDPSFRIRDGVNTLTSGPFMEDLSFRTHRPHYAPDAGPAPYEGLAKFLEARSTRDMHRGEGSPPPGLSLPGTPRFGH